MTQTPPDNTSRNTSEQTFQLEVKRNLTRNFISHLIHGMFGQTGFRLLNAPTFLPAYILLLADGSTIAVGIAIALQSVGMALTPIIGATLIEHRAKVLPVGFVSGTLMRLMVLGIALCGFFFNPDNALIGIYIFLTLFGIFSGMQGVIFNFLMSKVIPVSKRGRLTGSRNFLAGITSAVVAYLGGVYLLGDTPAIDGYSWIFVLAFVLTSFGLASLLFMREPTPPSLRAPSSVFTRLQHVPALLRAEPAFRRYIVARSLVTFGRMALPFYILYAGQSLHLNGANLAVLTIAFTLSGTVSNLLWGEIADRKGFRLVLLISVAVWVVTTIVLVISQTLFSAGLTTSILVFIGIGAAVQGFQNSAVSLTLEFGGREDLPLRIAIANTAAEFSGAIGPLIGGLLVALLGYEAVFIVAIVFLTIGATITLIAVPEPRHSL